ncbi:LytTR family transcriptional regulator DNA-binding domain-containing protein [Flammeovirga yaeyamensis]|uniref:LytTR family transcriptional regulator DNA-binding domain-containing protein n=1 Tax=Flammeovirga yaeyamensis TaxID=367791 RepID=A0AAX1NE86_9BACT|nr:LytTR family DNA-binding domain-containing protein [Flammeovirga yaeyamensis]MBB3697110.1 DNA-binding LytR/AlgR family response regulator [Flammeovirga yaeyamensis]NMF33773.1 response regulator transcription factor [Flammeovirga yaeyamensis]QWG04961.1 LytTR family transcriptional regulator DNA-binding domain-containing protein [Flammeovirga yaeyamensis]
MSKMNCVVIDDEMIAREGIAGYVKEIPYLNLVGKCKSTFELDEVLMQQKVDLIFLDIEMPGLTGIDWLKHADHPPIVIFTTAHREFALDGFELNATDYLLKPITLPRFSKAVAKAYKTWGQSHAIEEENLTSFFIKEDNQTVKIQVADITHVEAAVDYIYIHTIHKRHMTLFSMKQVEEQLPKEQFLRIHRSFIVNIDYVEAIEGKMLQVNGKQLGISRGLYQEVYDKITKGKVWKT